MATVPEYVNELLRRQILVAPRLGSDVLGADRQAYCLNLELLTIIAVLMKKLNDKGVVTDAEWLSALDVALDGDWQPWVIQQTPPPLPGAPAAKARPLAEIHLNLGGLL